MNEFDKIIVMGGSAGALDAMSEVVSDLPENFPYPILAVIHLPPDKKSLIADLLNDKSHIKVREALDKEEIKAGCMYFAPSDYHMLAEHDMSVSFSIEEPVLYSRPSIDVLFETAADSFADKCIGILLTGANSDGAKGLKSIHENGGIAIVQDPNTAYADAMPASALKLVPKAKKMSLSEINSCLKSL